jgi:hypothetical protein
MQSEIETYQNVIESQKRLLQSQQLNSAEKLKASEEKYTNLKHINTGLEVSLMKVVKLFLIFPKEKAVCVGSELAEGARIT